MTIPKLALASLLNRRWTAALTVFSIAVSVMLVLGVERLRQDARESFADTISGTDLIVGARSGAAQLLLYSVFRIGNATSNIRWKSYRDFAADRRVAWSVPLSLGDSHRGFRVLGTTSAYFEHYRVAGGRPLQLTDGRVFDDPFDVVLGAEAARALGYRLDQALIVEHGLGGGVNRHADKPFRVSGILAPTGTPVDRTLHVSLAGIEAMHIDFGPNRQAGTPPLSADAVRKMDLRPTAITAFLVGLKSKRAIFAVQREINDYRREPLMAILPGVALHELWSVVGMVEAALAAIAVCVLISAFLGMITMLLAGLNERRREIAVLRAVGAGPRHIALLLVSEAAALAAAGAALGVIFVSAFLGVAGDWMGARYGLYLSGALPGARDAAVAAAVIAAGGAAGVIPAIRAARQSLADGLIAKT